MKHNLEKKYKWGYRSTRFHLKRVQRLWNISIVDQLKRDCLFTAIEKDAMRGRNAIMSLTNEKITICHEPAVRSTTSGESALDRIEGTTIPSKKLNM